MRSAGMIVRIILAVLSLGLMVEEIHPVRVNRQKSSLSILGIFDESTSHLKPVFTSAILAANDLQEADTVTGVQLDLTGTDFKKSEHVCETLEKRGNVAAVIGFHKIDGAPFDLVRSITDMLEVPYIRLPYPEDRAYGKAVLSLVKQFDWTTFSVLYEDPYELTMLEELFRRTTSRYTVTFRQLSGPHYHDTLRELKTNEETRFILRTSPNVALKVLREAQNLRMITAQHHYILCALDSYAVDQSTFTFEQTKITAFQLIDSNATATVRHRRQDGNNETRLTTEEALVYDSVTLLFTALHNYGLGNIQPYAVDCDTAESWPQGSEISNAISGTDFEGMSGTVAFDAAGLRTNFHLDVIEAGEDGFIQVGTWDSKEGMRMGEVVEKGAGTLKGKILRAVTVYEEPYVMLKKDHEVRAGNDKFEGYAVDLMNRISEDLGFNYTVAVFGGHGVYDPVKDQWNGLIRELIDKRGDIAVGGITISHNREQVVDFTKPFMHLGISILYRKPKAQPPDLFSFLHPFSTDVWFYIVTALIGVSVAIFVLAKFTPYEWYNPHPCDEFNDVMENQFTIGNSIWFTVGSLMQQGNDVSPRAVSTRIVAGCWSFFTLIMIASYTANLAAFLAVERTDQPIKGADDLAKQTEIKYGCYEGGATYNFFKESKHPVYQKMWMTMNQDPNNFVKSGDQGIRKVLAEKYAYLMESPSLEYNVNKQCELVQVGGLLDSKGFGFATQQNSPYRDEISKTILRMQENSELELLKDKWWKGRGAICGGGNAQDANSELGMSNVGGVFVVLLAGIAVAFIITVIEFFWKVAKLSKATKRPFCEEVSRSFMYALKLHGPVARSRRKSGQLCLK